MRNKAIERLSETKKRAGDDQLNAEGKKTYTKRNDGLLREATEMEFM